MTEVKKATRLTKSDNFIKSLPGQYFHELEKAAQVCQEGKTSKTRYCSRNSIKKANHDFG